MKRVYLDDAVKRNKRYPTFKIPDLSQRSSLSVGDFAKVIFSSDAGNERMWIRVESVKDGRYSGQLNNDPTFFQEIKCGDVFEFGPENVIDIIKHGGSVSEMELSQSKLN